MGRVTLVPDGFFTTSRPFEGSSTRPVIVPPPGTRVEFPIHPQPLCDCARLATVSVKNLRTSPCSFR